MTVIEHQLRLAGAPAQFAILARVAWANRAGEKPTTYQAARLVDAPTTHYANRYKQVGRLIDAGALLDSGTNNRTALTITTAGKRALTTLGIHQGPPGERFTARVQLPRSLHVVAETLAWEGVLQIVYDDF